ncbi:MAG: glycosyltransferase family 39 protein [Actinobacteria bacterium]|nr:glycosyltransferase family 39 protein [Actinomycetota bacterium]MCL5883604.1 glycosyltransferase family 39 protein [Actinomycetota bacterium]
MPAPAGKRTDWIIAAGLFALTFLSRIPFRTAMLYAWDSVLYTRAIGHFDVTIDQPQPPGHVFYVGLVWLVNHATGDANSAMVWISIFFSAAAVAALFWLGKAIFNRDAGLIAALLLATSLSFWAYGEAAYPYTLLAFLSISLAGAGWRLWQGSANWLIPAGLLLGLASGFRQDLLPFMLPLLILGAWNKGWWRQAGSALLLVGGIAAWYIPSALLSGGFGPYQDASSRQSEYLLTYFSIFGRGAAGLWTNTSALGRFLLFGSAAAAALLLLLIVVLSRHETRRLLRDRRLAFLLVWMAPSVLFYALIHVGEYGYVFSFLPALLLLLAWTLQVWAGSSRLTWMVAVPLLLVNLLLFLVLSPPLSANRLAARDDILRSKIATIEQNFDPDTTLIVSVFDYQQARFYLPGYRNWTFDPSVEKHPAAALPPAVRNVVIFEEYLSPGVPGAMKLPLDRDQTLFYLSSGGSATLRIDWDNRKVYLEDE